MTDQSEREAFEKWANSKRLETRMRQGCDVYADMAVRMAWEAWQARASMQGRELKCTRFVDMGDGSNCLRCGQGAAYHARREELSDAELDLARQWYNALKDGMGSYLDERDHVLGRKLATLRGRRGDE